MALVNGDLKRNLAEVAKVVYRQMISLYSTTLTLTEGELYEWVIESRTGSTITIADEIVSAELLEGDVFRLYCYSIFGSSAVKATVKHGKAVLRLDPNIERTEQSEFAAVLTFVRAGVSVTQLIRVFVNPSNQALDFARALNGEQTEGITVASVRNEEKGFTLYMAAPSVITQKRVTLGVRLVSDLPLDTTIAYRVTFLATNRCIWFQEIQLGDKQDQVGISSSNLQRVATETVIKATLYITTENKIEVELPIEIQVSQEVIEG